MITLLMPLFGLLLVRESACQSQPSAQAWNNNWQANFTEKAWYFLEGNRTVTGQWKYKYDQNDQRFLIARDDGSVDRYCAGIFPFSQTKCSHLVINSNRYLVFPDKKYCCLCCTSKNGCGMSKPSWVVNGTYVSQSQVGQDTVSLYNIAGLQNNYYGVDQNQIPRRIYMEPLTDMSFDPKSYVVGQLTDGDFNLPTDSGNCNSACPYLSLCGLVRIGSAS